MIDLTNFKIPTSQRRIRSPSRMHRCVAGVTTNNSVSFGWCSGVVVGCDLQMRSESGPGDFTLPSATGKFISCTKTPKTQRFSTIYLTPKSQLRNDASGHQAECTDVLLV
jgi:hypothetical protein